MYDVLYESRTWRSMPSHTMYIVYKISSEGQAPENLKSTVSKRL